MTHDAADFAEAQLDNLVINDIGGETLVYDQASNIIHQLNRHCASVWRLCDGTRSVEDIAAAAALPGDAVRIALGKLADADLLVGRIPADQRHSSRSRRSFMKRAAIAGAIPAVVSVSAPLAVRATSHIGEKCGTGGLVCSEGQTCCGSLVCCDGGHICHTSPSVQCKCPNGSFPCPTGRCCVGSQV